MKPAINDAIDEIELELQRRFKKREIVMAKKPKRQDDHVAAEMLEGLEQFARDLKQLPPDGLKTKYRQSTVKVDFKPRTYDASGVKRVRRAMDCSQQIFADFIGVSVGTLRNWEQGIRPVSGAAARLLDEMRINPSYWKIRLSQSLKHRQAS